MFENYFNNSRVHPAPLAVFRISFGMLMWIALIRFWLNGWIESLYLAPKFHFKYYGFEWVDHFGPYTYVLYIICLLSTLGITFGYRYRLSIITFFLVFTYIELIDKTTYLNHYYFTSCVAFLLCFLPAGDYFSIDSLRKKKSLSRLPSWQVDALKLFLCIVYFYAGIAKINSDWLLEAQPLSLWLKSKYDIPLIGTLLQYKWVHYFASWSGMLYDVFIPFFLLYAPTRFIAFIFVVLFHIMTKIFFPPIGMFPYLMIFSALIFFDPTVHKRSIDAVRNVWKKTMKTTLQTTRIDTTLTNNSNQWVLLIFAVFFAIQLLFPFRYAAYPGELFWNEEGYRFSWRVMLMEKKGYTTFKIRDSISKKYFYVDNTDFLTPFQERQMSFQPDFILEYAHYLADHFEQQGHKNIQVFADSFVALNGRQSQRFIDPTIDLNQEVESFKRKTWVLPLNDEIHGL